MSACLPACLSACLSVCLSVCLPACLFVRLSDIMAPRDLSRFGPVLANNAAIRAFMENRRALQAQNGSSNNNTSNGANGAGGSLGPADNNITDIPSPNIPSSEGRPPLDTVAERSQGGLGGLATRPVIPAKRPHDDPEGERRRRKLNPVARVTNSLFAKVGDGVAFSLLGASVREAVERGLRELSSSPQWPQLEKGVGPDGQCLITQYISKGSKKDGRAVGRACKKCRAVGRPCLTARPGGGFWLLPIAAGKTDVEEAKNWV
ncbi:hypothetical protein IWX90DRAFT_234307 [Phyllosticta citrichinensis]|uniref:Uncharacterized protein n=1 Tax=Phyllosticta citrichinensis TaxID=1130410 RepID=A0ABR1XVI7_9PEZI